VPEIEFVEMEKLYFFVVFVTQFEVKEKKRYVKFLRQQMTSIEGGAETLL
jgi:DNA polymerase elongation subunit (family B)